MSPQAKAGAAGTLLAILAWSAWYTLDADSPADPGASLATADASVDIAPAAGPAPTAIDASRPTAATDTPPAPPAHASQPAPAVLRDGFEMRHGVLTAVRSPVDPNAVPPARTAAAAQVALPEGVRQEDVVVSVAGIVSVVRANVSTPAAQAAPGNDPASASSRAVTLTRAP